MFLAIKRLFSIPEGNPALIQSQHSALAKQIPMLYAIIIINTVAVAATHLLVAPVWLTCIAPAPVVIACLVRMRGWSHLKDKIGSHEQAVRRMRMTIFLSAAIGALLSLWGALLYPYGDAYQQAHVVYYMSITVIASIFCLLHLRAAVLALASTGIIPVVFLMISNGSPVMAAIAINFCLVVLAMLRVVNTNYNDFSCLIETQKQLILRQRETQELSDLNFRLANRDALTGLPNRRSFFLAFDELLANAENLGEPLVVGLIDLDGFKSVNDLHGHAAGDSLLIETARRLQAIVTADINVARMGGDEFALLISNPTNVRKLKELGERICAALRMTYTMNEIEVTISGSCGFAVHPEAGATRELLLEHADYALMHAKQKHRGSAVVFNVQHEKEIRLLNRIDQALRHANLEEEFTVVLQPIVDTKAGAATGFEALARWQSPTLGAVMPVDFIRAAERSELINRLTECLLRKTLAVMAPWPRDIGVSFNLSARDVSSDETILRLMTIIRESGIAPNRITFEITETSVMQDFEQARVVLNMLRHFGCRIALDDFGTGYSSLGYVHRLPLDIIKIDQVFVTDIETNKSSQGVVRTIAALCANLDLACVIEGVETPGQVRALQRLGCTTMQGHHFATPVTVEEFCLTQMNNFRKSA
jgi:diguanylate cyclase (GGDEF)-like protein